MSQTRKEFISSKKRFLKGNQFAILSNEKLKILQLSKTSDINEIKDSAANDG